MAVIDRRYTPTVGGREEVPNDRTDKKTGVDDIIKLREVVMKPRTAVYTTISSLIGTPGS
jgi:hypothetical protein